MNTKPRRAKASKAPPSTIPASKIENVIRLLERPEGATLETLMLATGWQAHSVRGALSGTVKRGRGRDLSSQIFEGVRVYRVAAPNAAG